MNKEQGNKRKDEVDYVQDIKIGANEEKEPKKTSKVYQEFISKNWFQLLILYFLAIGLIFLYENNLKTTKKPAEIGIIAIGEDGQFLEEVEVIFIDKGLNRELTNSQGFIRMELPKNSDFDILLRKAGYKPFIGRLDIENQNYYRRVYQLKRHQVPESSGTKG